jgi:DNA-binding SARP family transcriptional activator
MIRIRVLGAFEAEVSGSAAPLVGRYQRALLARLLTARGDVVSVDRLIDDLWRGEPPGKAIASLQTYVAHLRRLLEPERPPRAPARLLVSAAPGYALRLDGDAVDAWRFERLVGEARENSMAGPARARIVLGEALALWRGGAYAEVADEEWAVAETARLEELRLAARELSVAVTLRSAPPGDAVPAAEMLTRQQPLREEGWRLLALALWGSDRQADALSALRRARTILAGELGLDPGPTLTRLEDAILAQRMDVLHASAPGPAESGFHAVEPEGSGADGIWSAGTATRSAAAPEVFVGRDAELSVLTGAASAVLAGGSRMVLVTGEAGAGKSTLLARLRADLPPDQWFVTVGRCPEAEGAPPAWAWVEALGPLADRVPPGVLETELSPLLGEDQSAPLKAAADSSAGRFRLHRAVSAWLRAVARRRPLAVFLDDVHRADTETLSLLAALADELSTARILLVAAYRPSDMTDPQRETLAVLARHSPGRVPLAGLSADEVETLVTTACGRPVDSETVAALAERTGGNPFYVWESARLLASEGALVAISEVPEGVRDVLRRRLGRLPASAVAVLRLAAVVGREADVDVLVGAAETDEDGVLDALDAGVISGLLTEPAHGRVRFVHALVRDTLYLDLSRIRLTRMHARVAEALRALRPDDPTALAHHYARAASSATASLAVDYSLRAAELANRRYAHDTAVELLEQALGCLERVPGDAGDRDAERVELLGRLLRAQIRAGAVVAARTSRQRAIDVATAAGREDLLIAAFTAWTEPTPWHIRPYGIVDTPIVDSLTRLLRRTDIDPVARCRLLDALVNELDTENDPRSAAAVGEMEALVAGLGDPRLTALALTARLKETDYEREPESRARLCAELATVADTHDLVSHRWYAEYVASTAASVRGDVGGLRRHLDRYLEIAETYEMAETRTVGIWTEAAFAHIAGRFDDAERMYGEAREQMISRGSFHADSLYTMAVGTIRISQGHVARYEPAFRKLFEWTGALTADALVLALAAGGRREEARALRSDLRPLRHDYLFSLFATLRALAVLALGERDEAEDMIEVLLPVRDLLPGMATTSVAMRPVAHTLGELALSVGRRADAAEHFAHAIAVAHRWGAQRWESEAETALARVR